MNMEMLIGGKSVGSSDGKTIKNLNPYNGELIGTVPVATKQDVDQAVANAKEGFKTWAAMRNDERDVIIERFLDLLIKNKEGIAQLLCKEGGKTIGECRGEVEQSATIWRAYMKAASNIYGKSLPHNVEGRNTTDVLFTVYEPVGVTVCIAPFNYPLSTMTNKVAPALCAGNSIIMKPASDTPMSIISYAKLMLDAGMPENVVQVITGSGSDIGKWVTENKDVAIVSLTGSTEAGQTLHRDASDNLQRVLLELGGNCPLIMFEDCDIDKAVSHAFDGRIYNSGQICSASKRFIVHNSIKEEFTKRLIDKLSKVKTGNPMDDDVTMGCLINAKAASKVLEQIESTVKEGATCAYGGKKIGDTGFEPTVLTNVTAEMEIAKDLEVFGPVFPIIGFDTFEEAIEIANSTCYGLSAGVMTEDIGTAMKAAYQIDAGTCVINGTGDYRTSYHGFGGYKMSGIGREGAIQSIQEFSEIKTVVLRQVL